MKLRRILHATDFSSASKRALQTAMDFARQNKAELLIVHVLVPNIMVPADSYADPTLYVEMEKSERSQAEAELKKLIAKVSASKIRV
ncbi:MAG TPA: universal stress protein, partial [Candidatus Binatia bacterium]|nr:universal stress protein [Candidatus Binatia bacterium]